MNDIRAFPFSPSDDSTIKHQLGMTLRDYFAAKAFQVRLAKYDDWTLTELTEQAYLDADALLEARN
tara:strand:+ start:634 stop:831 length:198 start_codon:yes stop_codon:yes gene_type:complete